MSAVGNQGFPSHTDAARAVSVPHQRASQFDQREWVGLVDQHLPRMWQVVSSYDASLTLRHEACALAWLRLSQHGDNVAADLRESWLVMTARVELERALAHASLVNERTPRRSRSTGQ